MVGIIEETGDRIDEFKKGDRVGVPWMISTCCPCGYLKEEQKESEILIRVKFCAVCRTDLHLIEGDFPVPELPIIPGHQVVGIIEETDDCIDE